MLAWLRSRLPSSPPRPVPSVIPLRRGAGTGPVDFGEAERFLRMYHAEDPDAGALGPRLREVQAHIARYGTYTHTAAELAYGARVAWRNSSRCIGRLYWRSLRVRDRRFVDDAHGVAAGCVTHLREATGGGRIRPTITVFAQDRPDRPGPRIRNEQLIRYAGYPRRGGGVTGDARNVEITEQALRLGWTGDKGTDFDVLPLVIDVGGRPPLLATLPPDAVLEVPLVHPVHDWFAGLGLRWHAVPAISGMCLEIGGVCYPCAPFNGWYMGTEIGARNLADRDRYDRLGAVAEGLGLDISSDRTLWKDQALVELNVAVLHSFAAAGVTITDHHTESRRFLTHLEREERSGRLCPADWSWIVPPLSACTTPVFHRYYEDVPLSPAFVHHPPESDRT